MHRGFLVSIIVPIYNAMDYLEKCIQSIQNQSYRNVEIILVDDGSTDDSLDICIRYSKDDSRIKIIQKQNGGLVSARKTGLKAASGEYIGFVDSDDYIEPDMVSKLVKCLEDSGGDFVHSGYFEEGKSCIEYKNFSNEILNLVKLEQKVQFFKKYVFGKETETLSSSIVTKLFKRKFVKECYREVPNVQQYGEDLLCFCICILRGKKCAILSQSFYHYVIREESMSHKKTKKSILEEIQLHHYLLEIFQRYDCSNELITDISKYAQTNFLKLLNVTAKEIVDIPRFFYGEIEILRKKRVILYGAGMVGKDYYLQLSKYYDCEIVAWVDAYWDKIECKFAEIIDIKKAIKNQFDYILLALSDEKIAQDIVDDLEELGIDKNKILYAMPKRYY